MKVQSSSRPAFPALSSVFFFFSGFSGLLYQIVWLRMALGHFGVILPVLSTVVSLFMLGLGAGSWIAGRLTARRWGPRAWLRVYGSLEIAIAFWAAWVPLFYRWGETWLLPGGDMNSAVYLSGSAAAIAAAISPACVLMGTTYPVMLAVWRDAGAASKNAFSFLYRANVLGAVTGAFLAPMAFIELWGLAGSNEIGVVSNLAIGLSAWIYAGRWKNAAAVFSPSDPRPAASETPWIYGAALLISGFVSMAYEVMWTRELTPVLGTTIYAFASILVLYLLATWSGVSFYKRDLVLGRPRSLTGLFSVILCTSLFPVLLNDPRLGLGVAGAAVSLFPFCAALGYATPLLIDRMSGGNARRAGTAYALNVAGCVVGPLAASYLILPRMSLENGSVIFSGLFAVLVGGLIAWERWAVRTALASLAVWAALGAWIIAAGQTPEDHPFEGMGKAVVHRDYAATVIACGQGFERQLLVNGVGITRLTVLTKVMAHLPLLCHDGPSSSALLICFGMGTTYRSLLSWGLDVTAVELVPGVRDSFGYFHADAPQVLANPRGKILIDDGRRFLKRTSARYDLITLDPPPPVEAAGSGLLYSTDFYALVKTHLKPGGLLQQWWPGGERVILYSVARSLRQSFPYVRVYKGLGGQGFHFLASETPIQKPSLDECLRRWPVAARRDFLEWVPPSLKLPEALRTIFAEEIPIERLADSADVLAISDDRPFNEYYALRRLRHFRRGVYGVR